jgi:hypothetical protein
LHPPEGLEPQKIRRNPVRQLLSAESAAVDWLIAKLHWADHKSWLDRRSIRVGDGCSRTIDRGIADADVVLAAIFQMAIESKWVHARNRDSPPPAQTHFAGNCQPGEWRRLTTGSEREPSPLRT